MKSSSSHDTIGEVLRLGGGFAADERAGIVATLSSLDSRLQSFSAGTVDVLLTVKDRDAAGQRTMLETWIAGTERVVAASTRDDLAAALLEVRDETIRQITDAKNQTEARNNPRLRTGRGDKRSGGDR